MSSRTNSDLGEYFRLNISFGPEEGITVQTIKTSDAARGLRQIKTTKTWKRVKEIGRGGFGAVWLENTNDELIEQRAVKEISKNASSASSKIDYNRELEALALLSNHEEVFAKFYGWYENEHYVFFAMEFFMHGDLGKHIEERLPENETRLIAKQLLEGLVILHEQKWAHRNLKPQNIFVVRTAPDWWVKIGDFGTSKRIRGDETSFQTEVWSPSYVAPEVDDDDADERGYTIAVDMWSLGCVLYRLLALELPFPNRKCRKAYYRSRVAFPIEPLETSNISSQGIKLIKSLMAPLPSDRLTAIEASRDPWIVDAEECLFLDPQLDLHSEKGSFVYRGNAKHRPLVPHSRNGEDIASTKSRIIPWRTKSNLNNAREEQRYSNNTEHPLEALGRDFSRIDLNTSLDTNKYYGSNNQDDPRSLFHHGEYQRPPPPPSRPLWQASEDNLDRISQYRVLRTPDTFVPPNLPWRDSFDPTAQTGVEAHEDQHLDWLSPIYPPPPSPYSRDYKSVGSSDLQPNINHQFIYPNKNTGGHDKNLKQVKKVSKISIPDRSKPRTCKSPQPITPSLKPDPQPALQAVTRQLTYHPHSASQCLDDRCRQHAAKARLKSISNS